MAKDNNNHEHVIDPVIKTDSTDVLSNILTAQLPHMATLPVLPLSGTGSPLRQP